MMQTLQLLKTIERGATPATIKQGRNPENSPHHDMAIKQGRNPENSPHHDMAIFSSFFSKLTMEQQIISIS